MLDYAGSRSCPSWLPVPASRTLGFGSFGKNLHGTLPPQDCLGSLGCPGLMEETPESSRVGDVRGWLLSPRTIRSWWFPECTLERTLCNQWCKSP